MQQYIPNLLEVFNQSPSTSSLPLLSVIIAGSLIAMLGAVTFYRTPSSKLAVMVCALGVVFGAIPLVHSFKLKAGDFEANIQTLQHVAAYQNKQLVNQSAQLTQLAAIQQPHFSALSDTAAVDSREIETGSIEGRVAPIMGDLSVADVTILPEASQEPLHAQYEPINPLPPFEQWRNSEDAQAAVRDLFGTDFINIE